MTKKEIENNKNLEAWSEDSIMTLFINKNNN